MVATGCQAVTPPSAGTTLSSSGAGLALPPPQAFSCYMHVLVVRLFVESILRYGLPPHFQAAVVRPGEKSEGRLRAELDNTFGGGGARGGNKVLVTRWWW